MYFLIGNFIAIFLIILAFRESQNQGRIFLLTMLGLSFLLPRLIPSNTTSLLCFVGRLFLGVGSFIFLRWRGYFR